MSESRRGTGKETLRWELQAKSGGRVRPGGKVSGGSMAGNFREFSNEGGSWAGREGMVMLQESWCLGPGAYRAESTVGKHNGGKGDGTPGGLVRSPEVHEEPSPQWWIRMEWLGDGRHWPEVLGPLSAPPPTPPPAAEIGDKGQHLDSSREVTGGRAPLPNAEAIRQPGQDR